MYEYDDNPRNAPRHIYPAELTLRVSVLDEESKRTTRTLSATADRYGTQHELKLLLAQYLDLDDRSTLHIIYLGQGHQIRDDLGIDQLQPNDPVVVRIAASLDPVARSGKKTMYDSFKDAAMACTPGSFQGGDRVNLDEYSEEEEYLRAIRESKKMANITRKNTELDSKSPSLTYRERLGHAETTFEQSFLPPTTRDVTQRVSTSPPEKHSEVPRGIREFGTIVHQGTLSQYSLGTGGVSACTSICLVAAQWLIQNGIDGISSEVLDYLVTEGVQSPSCSQQHTCLDDLWSSSPHTNGLERGLPIQNMVSAENFLAAFNASWQYAAVENSRSSVAVVVTKAPETVLCFGLATRNNEPSWYLIDSHGDATETEKVAYVAHFSSTRMISEALQTKYPTMELDGYDHYTMQMLCQFEATPIIAAESKQWASPVPKGDTNLPAITSTQHTPQHPPVGHDLPQSVIDANPSLPDESCRRPPEDRLRATVADRVDDVALTARGRLTTRGPSNVSQNAAVVASAYHEEDETEPQTPQVRAEESHDSVELVRTPTEPKGRNDLLIAAPVCHHELDYVDINYARCAAATHMFRCMVTCCAHVASPSTLRWCGRCGRVVCKDCLRFDVSAVSSTASDEAASLVSVCLDCACHLLDTIEESSGPKSKIVAYLRKTLVEPRIEEILTRAKRLATEEATIKAGRKHHGALRELTRKTDELMRTIDEFAVQRTKLMDIDGEDSPMAPPTEADGTEHESYHPDPPQWRGRSPSSDDEQGTMSGDTFEEWKEAMVRAGRDKWPLPFNLKYPTPAMITTRNRQTADLKAWCAAHQDDFEAEFIAKREQMREKLACLVDEVAALQYHARSGYD